METQNKLKDEQMKCVTLVTLTKYFCDLLFGF